MALIDPELKLPSWVLVEPLEEAFANQAARWQQAGLLDVGEASAVGLVRQQKANWFLTDDTAARLVAASLGIEVHDSLGIVLWAAVESHITHDESNALLESLAQSSLWLSSRILVEAKLALTEIFKQARS